MKHTIKRSTRNKTKYVLSFYHQDNKVDFEFRTRLLFNTKEEANKKLEELISLCNDKDYVGLKLAVGKKTSSSDAGAPVLISELYKTYLIEGVSNEDVRKDRKTIWDKYLSPFYGDKNVNDINRNLMSSLRLQLPKMKTPKGNKRSVSYEKREKELLSENRQATVWKINKSFVRWGQAAGFIPNGDYFVGIVGFKKKKATVPITWNKEEFKQFISTVDNEKEKAIFITQYKIGLRKSEMFGLRFKDIDFANDKINVVGQLRKGKYRSTKNNKERSVHLPKEIKEYLLKFKQEYLNVGLNEKQVLDCYCFVNDKGNPYPAETLRRHFKKYIEKSGVKEIKFHDLRHSFCTNLISEGISPRYVALLAGDTVETIMASYVGATKTDEEKVIELLKKDCF